MVEGIEGVPVVAHPMKRYIALVVVIDTEFRSTEECIGEADTVKEAVVAAAAKWIVKGGEES